MKSLGTTHWCEVEKLVLWVLSDTVEIIICTCLVPHRIKQFPGQTCQISTQHSLLLCKPYNTVTESLPHFTKAAHTGLRASGQVQDLPGSGKLLFSTNTRVYIHISASHSGVFHADSLWLVFVSKAKIKFHIGLFCWRQSLLITGSLLYFRSQFNCQEKKMFRTFLFLSHW